MSLNIRQARADDLPRARKFYAERHYSGGIQPEDMVLLAERDDELVGIVRLTSEEGITLLRGMQVHPSVQRQGIGRQLLAAVVGVLGSHACFCIPYAHLVAFYGGIRFVGIAPTEAPRFLQQRLESYQHRGDGKRYRLMHRAGAAVLPPALRRIAPNALIEHRGVKSP